MSDNQDPYGAGLEVSPQFVPGQNEGDKTGGIIPYKNMPALLAYYLGLASLIPIFGFVLGVAAFILGVIGLRNRAKNPVIKGSIHAWIGILLGGLMAVVWAGLVGVFLVRGFMSVDF
jgi:hypothetical protein